ncbi:DUF190 domain-containing protein [Pararhodospirillum photometricum]|uniref:DUF190 domain-containing protein n=1 Tax=Pararhodospirillum photometricum TaxID=1084 RepID=UPI000312E4E8|nr:DUF190 domain-containing protein [Pararhodospirillum photometricum]
MLRIFVGEAKRHGAHPLYETLVLEARAFGLAGATVLRGPLGYGRSSQLHTTKILRLSDDLPMVVEIVDDEERLDAFLPTVKALMQGQGGLVTLEKVRVIPIEA